jgi:hypothetical protein
MKVVINGTEVLLDITFGVLNVCHLRWKDINRQYSRGSWYESLYLQISPADRRFQLQCKIYRMI